MENYDWLFVLAFFSSAVIIFELVIFFSTRKKVFKEYLKASPMPNDIPIPKITEMGTCFLGQKVEKPNSLWGYFRWINLSSDYSAYHCKILDDALLIRERENTMFPLFIEKLLTKTIYVPMESLSETILNLPLINKEKILAFQVKNTDMIIYFYGSKNDLDEVKKLLSKCYIQND